MYNQNTHPPVAIGPTAYVSLLLPACLSPSGSHVPVLITVGVILPGLKDRKNEKPVVFLALEGPQICYKEDGLEFLFLLPLAPDYSHVPPHPALSC